MQINNPSDPKLDRWLRKQPPRLELALRYAMRGRFRNIIARHHFSARIDELFGQLAPDGDEYAAILRHAREIGEAMEKELDGI
jgi:hypothetical protein